MLFCWHSDTGCPQSRLLPALGPVARDCVRQSPCPVVTVPIGTGQRPGTGIGDEPPVLPGRAAWPLSVQNARSEADREGVSAAVLLLANAATLQWTAVRSSQDLHRVERADAGCQGGEQEA